MRTQQQKQPQRLLTFASGGWVLLLAALITLIVLAVTIVPALLNARNRPPGDWQNPGSYGFELSNALVPLDLIVAGQSRRDVVEPLTEPPVMPGSQVAAFNAEHRGKYLVPTDRVIGVTIDGEARAYPLVLLKLHEIANDSLAGTPIAVTYNPLCDSAVVFDRRVAGEVLEFGISGLLYNSNLLMYDRRPDMAGESLWSQLQARAIAGPAADERSELEILPATLTHWSDWMQQHPETTVIEPDPEMLRRYHETSYSGYLQSEELMFQVSPLPPGDQAPQKTRCAIVRVGEEQRVYALPHLLARAGDGGIHREVIGGEELEFRVFEDPLSVRITRSSDGELTETIYAFWFAWYAAHPGAELVDLGSS